MAINMMLELIVAISTPRVVLESAIHLYLLPGGASRCRRAAASRDCASRAALFPVILSPTIEKAPLPDYLPITARDAAYTLRAGIARNVTMSSQDSFQYSLTLPFTSKFLRGSEIVLVTGSLPRGRGRYAELRISD
jgi:hypothetical protein